MERCGSASSGRSGALMQFFCSPILGMLSDRFGRRPVLLLSLSGLALDYVVMALSPTIGWLVVGRTSQGITAASLATGAAYIADVTKPEERAGAYGYIGAAWGVGFVLGPTLGGFLGNIDARLPFWVAAGMTLLNVLYGLFVLPESLPPERRVPFDGPRKPGRVFQAAPVSPRPAQPGRRAVLLLRVAPRLAVGGRALHRVPVWMDGGRHRAVLRRVWGNQYPRAGSPRRRGGQAARRARGHVDWPGLRGGRVRDLRAPPTSLIFCLGLPIFALDALNQPSVMGLMTRYVSPSEQGQLQGTSAAVMGVTGLFAPGLFSAAFSWAIHGSGLLHHPGLPLGLAAAFLGAGMLLGLQLARNDAPAPAEATE